MITPIELKSTEKVEDFTPSLTPKEIEENFRRSRLITEIPEAKHTRKPNIDMLRAILKGWDNTSEVIKVYKPHTVYNCKSKINKYLKGDEKAIPLRWRPLVDEYKCTLTPYESFRRTKVEKPEVKKKLEKVQVSTNTQKVRGNSVISNVQNPLDTDSLLGIISVLSRVGVTEFTLKF